MIVDLRIVYMDLVPDGFGGHIPSVHIEYPQRGARLVTRVRFRGKELSSPVPVMVYQITGRTAELPLTAEDELGLEILEGESDIEFAERLKTFVCKRRKVDAQGKPMYAIDGTGAKVRALVESVPLSESWIVHKNNVPLVLIDRYVGRMRAACRIGLDGEFALDESLARSLFSGAAAAEAWSHDAQAKIQDDRETDPVRKAKIAKYRGDIAQAKAKMLADAQTMTLQQLIDYGDPWPTKP